MKKGRDNGIKEGRDNGIKDRREGGRKEGRKDRGKAEGRIEGSNSHQLPRLQTLSADWYNLMEPGQIHY